MNTTELLTRARVGTSVLSAKEKLTFPSAALKGHRNFKFSFWNYMAACLLWTIQNSSRARARGDFCIVHNGKVDIPAGLFKGPQKFQIQVLKFHGGFSTLDNTELLTRARARTRARPRGRARAGTSVLSTIEKSTCPSASLKGHRNFKFCFWNYMAVFLLWTIQNSPRARARVVTYGQSRVAVLYCPQ